MTLAKRWLESRRLPAVAIVLGVVLSLPSLRIGLALDDLWHRSMLSGGQRWAPFQLGWSHLFDFVRGEPDELREFIDKGFGPWWATPGLRISFFRPLSCLTHALDYALWPKTPALMHAHSILWYAALLAVVSVAYRRWLPPLAANVAILFYAIDPTHGLPVSWIANRNALVAATFAFGALILWDMGRRWTSGAVLALALASGESALAILGFFVAHWVFLDRPEGPDGRRRPLRQLLPIALAVAIWIVVYRLGHHGVRSSGIYSDPVHAPLDYLASVVAHVPVLLAVELGAPPPDMFPFYPPAIKLAFVVVALGFLAWAAKVMPRSPKVGFFVLGALLAVFPGAATFPAGRLLVIGGFGVVGALAIACTEGRSRAFRGWAWLSHGALAPLLFLANVHGMAMVDGILRGYGRGVPVDGSAEDKRLVLVNAPDTSFIYYVIVIPLEEGQRPPPKMLAMAGNRRDLRLTRTGPLTFTVHEDDGFYREGTEVLFADPSVPMHEGQVIEQSDTRITITHVLPDGRPDEARFELLAPFDHYVFREWRGKTLVPWTPPAIGETVAFPGRMMDIL